MNGYVCGWGEKDLSQYVAICIQDEIAEVVRNLISPWTASKISVSRGIPDELIQLLGTGLQIHHDSSMLALNPMKFEKLHELA